MTCTNMHASAPPIYPTTSKTHGFHGGAPAIAKPRRVSPALQRRTDQKYTRVHYSRKLCRDLRTIWTQAVLNSLLSPRTINIHERVGMPWNICSYITTGLQERKRNKTVTTSSKGFFLRASRTIRFENKMKQLHGSFSKWGPVETLGMYGAFGLNCRGPCDFMTLMLRNSHILRHPRASAILNETCGVMPLLPS